MLTENPQVLIGWKLRICSVSSTKYSSAERNSSAVATGEEAAAVARASNMLRFHFWVTKLQCFEEITRSLNEKIITKATKSGYFINNLDWSRSIENTPK